MSEPAERQAGRRTRRPVREASVARRIVIVGVLVLLAAFAVAIWPQQVDARECENAFAAKDDQMSDYIDGLRAGAGLPLDTGSCNQARADARHLALGLAGAGVLVMLAGWVVSARRQDTPQ